MLHAMPRPALHHMLPRLAAVLCMVACLLCLSACHDEEQMWPSYVQDLACLQADADGRGTTLVLDNGTRYGVNNPPSGMEAHEARRVCTYYLLQANGGVRLMGTRSVLVAEAKHYAPDKCVCDPLTLMAAWTGGGFLNLRLALMASAAGSHYMAFHLQEAVPQPDGALTQHLLLLHDQNADPLYFTREVYLSMPLASLTAATPQQADSVCLHVFTFKGETTLTLPLP